MSLNYETSQSFNPTIDYFLTLDMAKEIAMVERNEKGKQARIYFLECEKRLFAQKPKELTKLEILELALESEKKVIALQKELEAQKDDVEFAQQLKDTTNSLDFATAAKAMQLPYGRNLLFQKCRELKILNSKIALSRTRRQKLFCCS